MSQGGNRKNAHAGHAPTNSDVGASQDGEGGPAIAHAPNSDVGGSQKDEGGGPPPVLSTSPSLPRPSSSTPPTSPSSRPSTPPTSPSSRPSTPPTSPPPQWSTPPTSPSPQWSTPPTSPSPQWLTPPTSSPPPSSTPPPLSPSPSPSPPQSPVSVLPSATTDEISPYFWGSNVDNCAEQRSEDNKETILSLIAEVDPQNKVVIEKIEMLSRRYKYFRPIEGDGSCFYRAFIFSYLERVLDIEDESERCSEVTRFRQCIENGKQAYGDLYPPWKSQTSLSTEFAAFEHVFGLIGAGLSAEELYWVDMEDNIISNIITPLRSLTEIELRTQEDFYSPFLFSEEEFESVHKVR